MRGCIMLHSKPVKYGTGVMAIIKKIAPLLEAEGYFLDFLITEPQKRNLPDWLIERNVVAVPKNYKPLPARGFGIQGQGIQMFFENLNFYQVMFERLQKVHYDFVFCLGSNGFHLLSMYGVNKHLPLWCDMNLEAWEDCNLSEMQFLYGMENVWVSAHEALEPVLKKKHLANAVFKTTFPVNLADNNDFDKTEDKVCIVGNKRVDKTPNIDKLDKVLDGKLTWLSGMPEAPELTHGTSYAMLHGSEYTNAIRNCRYGVVLSRYECLGVAILEQAALQPVFIRDYGDWRNEWIKIHSVLPTWKTYAELEMLMLKYSKKEEWEAQVQKQREYIANNFTAERLKVFVKDFINDIAPEMPKKPIAWNATMSVKDILASKGWNDGVGALGFFRKMKGQKIRTVETGNETFFTDDNDFKPESTKVLSAWEVF